MNFLNPKKIISQMLSLEDSLVADFGFGSGEFLRFLSKSAGEGGRVYAIDIQPEIVKKISKDFDEENITNTNFLTVDLEKNKSTDISENSLDFVLLSSVLFQSDKKESILKETLRVLRPGGRLLLIDWKDSFFGIGPEKENIFEEKKALDMLQDLSVTLEKKVDAGDYHYGLLYRKE